MAKFSLFGTLADCKCFTSSNLGLASLPRTRWSESNFYVCLSTQTTEETKPVGSGWHSVCFGYPMRGMNLPGLLQSA